MNKPYIKDAEIFKALGDENRLQIMEMLKSGEKCACKLLEALEIGQPTLSHHMKILCEAELITGRKEGKWTHYSINEAGVEYVAGRIKAMTEAPHKKPIVAFICTHNSCRSQIAEALGKHLAAEVFESYSAGTELKPQINQDAVRIMKKLYNIDMTAQYSKLISDIPKPDYAVSMGCGVACPLVEGGFDDDWGLPDPTGKSDEEFIRVIREIETDILKLKEKLG